MQLQEQRPTQSEDHSFAKEYAQGLITIVKKWDSLDTQTKRDAVAYYTYTLSVLVGLPTAAVVAFLSRL